MIHGRTKVKIVLQGREQSFGDYEAQLQNHLDTIGNQENVRGGVMCFPTSASDGRLNTLIQWLEFEKETEEDQNQQ